MQLSSSFSHLVFVRVEFSLSDDLVGSHLGDFFFAVARANFSYATLAHANLFGADLTTADFTHSDLRKATMTDAKITRAKFAYANLEGCIGTNGRPWGFTVKPKQSKKAWWKVWNNAAL